jgi:hypothetical protein
MIGILVLPHRKMYNTLDHHKQLQEKYVFALHAVGDWY